MEEDIMFHRLMQISPNTNYEITAGTKRISSPKQTDRFAAPHVF
jgi:hypothetical protein